MAIRIVNVEPVVHAVAWVNKTPGRPKVHPDRMAYRAEWMRQRRAAAKADARLVAVAD
jgi:hypothetical protein